MEFASLIPAPDALPIHWLWLQLLLTLTTFIHLVAMNLMLGAGIIGLATPHSSGGEVVALRRDIGRTLPITIALTINLGVAPLLFLQVLYGQYFYTSSVLMASLWLGMAVIFLALVGLIFTNNLSLMQQPAARSITCSVLLATRSAGR